MPWVALGCDATPFCLHLEESGEGGWLNRVDVHVCHCVMAGTVNIHRQLDTIDLHGRKRGQTIKTEDNSHYRKLEETKDVLDLSTKPNQPADPAKKGPSCLRNEASQTRGVGGLFSLEA